MNPEASPLLAQLQDIHGAASPGWWPPAPGWWVLAALLLGALFFALRRLRRGLDVRRRRRAWLLALEDLNRRHDPLESPREFLADLNRLFRAVAVRAFPDTTCTRLQGEEWVSFIVSLMPDGTSADSLRALASGPYQPLPSFEAGALNDHARIWVMRYG